MNKKILTQILESDADEFIESLGAERYLTIIEEEIRQKREFIDEHIKEIAVLKIDLRLLYEEHRKIKGLQNDKQ